MYQRMQQIKWRYLSDYVERFGKLPRATLKKFIMEIYEVVDRS